MRYLSQMRIRVLLPALFGLVIVIAFAQGGMALFSLATLKQQVHEIGRERMPRNTLIAKMDHSINVIRRSYADLLLANDAEEIKANEQTIATRMNERDALIKQYSDMITLPKTRELFATLQNGVVAYDAAAKTLVGLVEADSDPAGSRLSLTDDGEDYAAALPDDFAARCGRTRRGCHSGPSVG